MLDQCCANVVDGGPALFKHWVDVSGLLGSTLHIEGFPYEIRPPPPLNHLYCMILYISEKCFHCVCPHVLLCCVRTR